MRGATEDRTDVLLACLAACVAGIAMLGCGSPEPGTESSGLPDGTPLRVASEPTLDVGVTRGDTARQFHGVTTPFLFGDGRLAVPNGGSNEIRVFGPGGSLVRTLGGAGRGPGEFSGLDAAWHRGDTVEAWDWRLRRLTRFMPDDSVAVVSFEAVSGARRAVPGPLPGGLAVVGVAGGTLGARDTMAVHHFGLDGSHRTWVARIRGMSRFRTQFGGGPDPLSPRPQFDVARGNVYVAETLTPEIRVLSPTGDSLRTIAWKPEEGPSPEEAARRTIRGIVARQSPDDTARLRKRLRAFPVREELSAFWSLLVDEEGFVWVQRYDPERHSLRRSGTDIAGPGGEWIVFSPDGQRLTTVRMPEGLRPTEITSDAVVGISRNDVGVETVRVHPLERR